MTSRCCLFSAMAAAALLACASPSLASAAALTDAQILSQFNLVTFGNASTGSDIEGAVAIGGNLTNGATFYNNPGPEQSAPGAGSAAAAGYGAVNVFGSIAAGIYNVNNGGNVVYGGTNAGHFNTNGGGTVSASPALTAGNFASQFQSPLTQLSQALAALTANSSLPSPATTPGYPNNVAITAAANLPSGISVFNISGADLASLASFTVNTNGASTVVFNVNVAQVCTSSPSVCSNPLSLSANFNNAQSVAPDIIWNFYNATSLNFNTAWGGTILAPYASVANASQLNGTLIASAYNGSGELHDAPFAGTLSPPEVDTSTDAVPAPEPSAALVLMAGLLALGFVRWRRPGRAA